MASILGEVRTNVVLIRTKILVSMRIDHCPAQDGQGAGPGGCCSA